jgi:hypothetical protein
VLARRSGRLATSIEADTKVTADRVSGTVDTSVPYAAFQEYGFSGAESVRAQLRTIATAFGKLLKGGSRPIAVRAYERQVEAPARSFLRSALAEMAPRFRGELGEALFQALAP